MGTREDEARGNVASACVGAWHAGNMLHACGTRAPGVRALGLTGNQPHNTGSAGQADTTTPRGDTASLPQLRTAVALQPLSRCPTCPLPECEDRAAQDGSDESTRTVGRVQGAFGDATMGAGLGARGHPPPLPHARPVVHHALQDHRPLGQQEVLPEVLKGRAVQPGHRSAGHVWTWGSLRPGFLFKVKTKQSRSHHRTSKREAFLSEWASVVGGRQHHR